MGISWNNLWAGARTGYSTSFVMYNLTNAGVTANQWHHVAATFVRSSRTLTLYLDGQQVAQGVLPSFTSTGNGFPLEIGRNGNTGGPWNGKLDDMRQHEQRIRWGADWPRGQLAVQRGLGHHVD
jgi:hypothetical protein